MEVIIRASPNSYSGLRFAVHRDNTFSIEKIQWTMRSIYRTAERDEREKVSIGIRKTIMVAYRGSRGWESHERTERT